MSISPQALAALHRAMLWREAAASVALDHDERVQTIRLDDLDDSGGLPTSGTLEVVTEPGVPTGG